MKFFKKLLLLGLVILSCFCAGFAVACDEETPTPTPPPVEEPVDYVYKIRTQSEGGFGLRGVTVELYNGETKVHAVNTSATGNAFFLAEDVPQTGEYDIRLSNVPEGWSIKDETITYKTSAETGTEVNINFTASLISTPAEANKKYRVGDVMHDFTITNCDGETFTLSSALENKRMVLLNFWATWCGPCKDEFPHMQNAYAEYQDYIDIVALSNSDSQSAVADFRDSNGYTFLMGGTPDSNNVMQHFNTTSIPVSAVVDRFGVISYVHLGGLPSANLFTDLFDRFVGDDYVQTVIESDDFTGGSGGDTTVEMIKPNVSAPTLSDVAATLSPDNTAFTYSWEEDDEYAWPWTVNQETVGEQTVRFIKASNANIHSSYAILNVDFTATADSVLAFDTYVFSEKTDILYVLVDGTIIHTLSGAKQAWETCYAYVFNAREAGEHTLSLIYRKDATITSEDDIRIKNLRFEPKTVLDAANTDVNIFRYAATEWNEPTTLAEGETKKYKFNSYVNVALGSDGYYHVVSSPDAEVDITRDPVLFADIMNATRWNMFDLWQLAYNGVLVYNGFNLGDAVEGFAWSANESANGFVPVTEELQQLLDLIVQMDVVGEVYDEEYRSTNYYDEDYHLAYHDREWLELCHYYEHFGDAPVMQDPTRGITFEGAIEIFADMTPSDNNAVVNHINCFKSMVPLGIKHKFTPTVSGVYHFYSIVDKQYFDKGSHYNPQMWLIDSDKKTHLAYNEDCLIAENPENFDIKYYLEAGETYYCLFAFFLNAMGEFDMKIDYLGSSYANLTNCAIGPYSYNTVTSETYVQNPVKYAYDEANDVYRITDNNGTFLHDIYGESYDDRLYLDMAHVTYLFNQPLGDFVKITDDGRPAYEAYTDITKRLFYLPNGNGGMTDYSETMATYLFLAELNNQELYGMMAVNAELMHIMQELTKKYDGFGGIKNSWQMMCYYYQPLGQF